MIDKGVSSIVFDCTTLLRWERPAVGIVRTQLEVAKYLLGSPYKTDFVAFKSQSLEMFPVPKEYLMEKIAQLSTIKFHTNKQNDPLRSASKRFRGVLDRLIAMNQIAEDILKKIDSKRNHLKSYKEGLLDELSALTLAPIPKRTKNLFDKESLFISMGLDWEHSNYPLLYRLKQEIGFRFVGIFYDGIILRHPEWAVSEELAKKFSHHFYYLAYLCDALVSISEYSKTEFLHLTQERYIDFLGRMKVLRLGDRAGAYKQKEQVQTSKESPKEEKDNKLLPVLSTPTIFLTQDPVTGELVSANENDTAPQSQKTALLPRFKGRTHKDPYILYVSTLEPRKNHMLLLDVWELLLQRQEKNIPDLVLVGMRGWKMDDFFDRYQKSDELKKYIHWYDDVLDEELAFLYEEALFSVFPAFDEGFGLGVVESMSYDKPAIISNAPALIEATQGLMPSLDPNDKTAWAIQISQWCNNEYEVKQYTKRIKEQFKRQSWVDFAEDFVEFALESCKDLSQDLA